MRQSEGTEGEEGDCLIFYELDEGIGDGRKLCGEGMGEERR